MRCTWIVRHHNNRLLEFSIKSLKNSQNFVRRLCVEVAGGFVCKNQIGIRQVRRQDCT